MKLKFSDFAAFTFAGVGGLYGGARAAARQYEKLYPPNGRKIALEDGLSLHLIEREASDGETQSLPLVLLHGASGNARDSDEALGALLSTDARVLSVDRPGHGWSERRPEREAAAPDAQAKLIARALRDIGVGRAVIVGHSLGASVACALALVAPEMVAGLVLIAPATHPWPGGGISWHNHVAATDVFGPFFASLFPPVVGPLVMSRVLPSIFAPNPVPPDYAERIGAALVLRPQHFHANAVDIVDLNQHLERLSAHYPDITAPTLAIAGAEDRIVSNAIHAAGLVRDIPGARLVELPGIGHMAHWAATETVARLIKEFAAGLY